MTESRDAPLLEYVWLQWRNETGSKMRTDYIQFLNLLREDQLDPGVTWRKNYLMDHNEFKVMAADIYSEILPLYESLFAYVRRRMQLVYPEMTGYTMDAHLLGDMFAQSWTNLYKDLIPFPNQPKLDITNSLISHGYTPRKMFKQAENFYNSIGLQRLSDEFWEKSMFEKPADGRAVNCHAGAAEVGKVSILRMCAKVDHHSMDVLLHHELGHVYYASWYRRLPIFFRESANSAFHEAVGNAIGLSTKAPSYYQQIGLTDSGSDRENYELKINALMLKALGVIPFAAYSYMLEKYRWSLFDGTVSTGDLNSYYWDLRHKYQGVVPPVTRNDEADFDAGAKMHVASNIEYMKYFLANVLSFQFHEAMCRSAGHQEALFNCSIYGSKVAGEKLKKVLKAGISQPWPNVLKEFTGSSKISAKSMLTYFDDLHEWLKKENAHAGACYGWGFQWSESIEVQRPRC